MSVVRACPKCGEKVVSGAAFCAYCGERLPESEPVAVIRSIPIPDLTESDVPCTVIYSGKSEIDVRMIGRIVAGATKRLLADVTRDLRTSKGIIASGLPAEAAKSLAEQVGQELQAKILVVPSELCVPLPPPMRMNRSQVDARGIRCEAYAWDTTENISVEWKDVFLVACGRLEMQKVTEVTGAAPSEAGLLSYRKSPLVTHVYHEFLLDVVLSDPWRVLRFDQNMVGLSFTEIERDPKDVLGPLYQCALNICRHATGVPMNSGVQLLASGAADATWGTLTFYNKRDFESYVQWLMQLVRFSEPILT